MRASEFITDAVDRQFFTYKKPSDATTSHGYKLRINPFDDRLQVKVYDRGILIGEFVFVLTHDGEYAYSENSWVHEPYRRKGIASEVYSIVNKLGTGIDIIPSEEQTDDGKKLWRKLKPVLGDKDEN